MSAESVSGKSPGRHRPPLEKIVLGSRGSELARTQTAMVIDALRTAWPNLEIVTEILSTRGDVRAAEPIDPRAGRKGLFTGEIESALLAGKIDVAVHSAKDLPSEMTAGLELRAVLPRAPAQDVLVSKGSASGPIATGSVRRQHQLRWKFPGVEILDLRGNVPTRLRKLVENDWRGIVLARAGLERLGYDVAGGSFEFEGSRLGAETLSSEDFLGAGGQGIIGLQIRRADENARAAVEAVNDAKTFSCLEAEREFLRLLQGDCASPVGVLATIDGSMMTLRAQVFVPPQIEPRMARVEGDGAAPAKLARELWEAING
jgi:hydroxymethylbilane synthase